MKILKDKYIKNIIGRLENINIGSYHEEDWDGAEDYFAEADNIENILEILSDIIPNGVLTEKDLKNLQNTIDDIKVELSEPPNYPNFYMFYEDREKLKNVVYSIISEEYIVMK